jgi:hypothetical protein
MLIVLLVLFCIFFSIFWGSIYVGYLSVLFSANKKYAISSFYHFLIEFKKITWKKRYHSFDFDFFSEETGQARVDFFDIEFYKIKMIFDPVSYLLFVIYLFFTTEALYENRSFEGFWKLKKGK